MKLDSPLREEYARAVALFEAMDRLYRQWGRFFPPPPLKKSDVGILGVLTHLEAIGAGPVTVGSLAKETHQSPPAISQKLNELHRLGYVTRQTDETDRRVMFIALTDSGRQVADDAIRGLLERIEHALDRMGDGTDKLVHLMNRLGDSIEQVAAENTADNDKGETKA